MEVKTNICILLIMLLVITACSNNVEKVSRKDAAKKNYPINVTVAGLNGELVLNLNSEEQITVDSDGTYQFDSQLVDGSDYNVVIFTQPKLQTCTTLQDSGNVTNNVIVSIGCFGRLQLDVKANATFAEVTWDEIPNQNYKLYVSTQKGLYPDGNDTEYVFVADNAKSPFKVTPLLNGTPYYFTVVTNYPGGFVVASEERGARPEIQVLDGVVNTIAYDGQNTVYVGGKFSKIGPRTGSGITVDADSGNISDLNFPLINGKVHVVISDDEGGWFIGGKFTKVGSVRRDSIAHILSDGSVDPGFLPSVSGTVDAMDSDLDNLYIGGNFVFVNGIRRNAQAKISKSGALLSWNPINDTQILDIAACGSNVFSIGFGLKMYDQAGSEVAFSPELSGNAKSIEASNNKLYIGSDCIFLASVYGVQCAALKSFDCTTKNLEFSLDFDFVDGVSSDVEVNWFFAISHG